ncbi:hypothetical protein PoB_003569000 [Plakobranchus ocellatus]|uniref:Uncharacterized protein n=1 Tax=Plakobranchus ocellatus TaxID=259542 RepID=A0AAV4APA6_9GAST|nr:hypothetical protein PoB_003569000 [Plakobranchus ocellatus]
MLELQGLKYSIPSLQKQPNNSTTLAHVPKILRCKASAQGLNDDKTKNFNEARESSGYYKDRLLRCSAVVPCACKTLTAAVRYGKEKMVRTTVCRLCETSTAPTSYLTVGVEWDKGSLLERHYHLGGSMG